MERAAKALDKEQEAQRQKIRTKGNQRAPQHEMSDRAKKWAVEHVAEYDRNGTSSHPKSKFNAKDLSQDMEITHPKSIADSYESPIQWDEHGNVRYAEPYEVDERDRNDPQAIDEVANDNFKQRLDIRHDVQQQLFQTPEFDLSQDEVYKDLQEQLKEATIAEAKAKAVEHDAQVNTKEATSERMQRERDLQKSKRADQRNAQKSFFSISKHMYLSKTPEKRKAANESRDWEAKVKTEESKATKARESAEQKRKGIEKAIAAHMSQRSKALKARTYEIAPVLKRYDEAISQQRDASRDIRAKQNAERRASREAARTTELNKDRDGGRDLC